MMAHMTRLAVSAFNRDAMMRLRAQAGMTQEDLAVQIGVSTTSISSWELGRSAPEPANYEKLAKVLKARKGELLGAVDPLRGLAEHRARAGLSQRQAADEIGIPVSALRTIERGVRLPTPQERAALAKAYRISRAEVERLTTALHEHRKGGRA